MKTSFRPTAALLMICIAVFSGCSTDNAAKTPTAVDLEHELTALTAPAGATTDQPTKPSANCAALTQKYRYRGGADELSNHYNTIATANGWSPIGSVGEVDAGNGSAFLKDLNNKSIYLSIKMNTDGYNVVLRGVDSKAC